MFTAQTLKSHSLRSLFKSYASPLISLAAPVVAARASSMMVSVADTFMVGRVGEVELAAVSFASNLTVPLMFFGIGVAAAVTPLIGRRLGRGRIQDIGLAVAHARRVNVALTLLQLLVLSALIVLLPFMGQPEEIVDLARGYLAIMAVSMVGQQMFVCSNVIIEGLQDTKTPMVIGVASNVLNIVLNYILIFGLEDFGIPFAGYGVYGAAVSTLIARTLMWLAIEVALRRKLRALGVVPKAGARRGLSWRLAVIGLPVGVQSLVECLGFAFGGIMMGWICTQAIAAHQVVNLFTSLTFLMVGGLGTAVTIKVSVSVGAAEERVAKRFALTGLVLTAIFMSCTAIFFAMMADVLPALVIDGEETLAIAASLMMVGALFQVVDGLQVVAIAALRGYADFAYPARVAAISYGLTCAPVGYIVAFVVGVGPAGIWWGFVAGLALAAVLLLVRLKRRFFSTAVS